MRNVVQPSEVLSASNPALDVWTTKVLADEGREWSVAADPTSLFFTVYSESATGAQVAVGGEQTVDLSTAKIASQVGHFAAAFTAPATEGRYLIRWRVVPVSGPQQTFDRYFDVAAVPTALSEGLLVTLSDMRAEELLVSDAPNNRLLKTIRLAQQMFERYTQRRFGIVQGTFSLDGNGSKLLPLGEAIILATSVSQMGGDPLESDSFVVYNRHIRQGLFSPDDRDFPFLSRGCEWDQGRQNFSISGLWGYTEYDGSPTGGAPELAKQAIMMIAFREFAKLGDQAERQQWRDRWRLKSEKTRDQSYDMSPQGGEGGGAGGAFTGDRAIDDIILLFRKTLTLGAA